MERLRSKGIEPFNFEEADMSDDLWLGEGFTNYFDGLVQHRAGFSTLDEFGAELAGVINAVTLSPGRIFRNAVDMSRLAPFVDAAVSVDRTAWPNLFISYYTYGQAIGLGLDLSLRDRSNGKVTADEYMRALWARFGRPGQKEPGKVATAYSIDGLKETLATVSGDRNFANDFFSKFVEGKDLVDYGRLLGRPGLVMRKRAAGRPFAGQVQLTAGGSALRVQNLVPWESALYKAGVSQDDQLVELDGTPLVSMAAWDSVFGKHKAGDRAPLRYVRRSGETVNTTLTFDEDPRVEVVPIEKTGGTLTDDQRRFRESWLTSLQKK
jgi:predicted metalloprotease with PDZ domain